MRISTVKNSPSSHDQHDWMISIEKSRRGVVVNYVIDVSSCCHQRNKVNAKNEQILLNSVVVLVGLWRCCCLLFVVNIDIDVDVDVDVNIDIDVDIADEV